jgi:hypothetical protein
MKIGIFWYYQNQIIGIAHEFQKSDQDSLGLIDSPYTHVEYWETLRDVIPEFRNIEYEEIPRGRVIYNAKTSKSYVYMDAKLLKNNIARKVADFFELNFECVIWKKDPHYKT